VQQFADEGWHAIDFPTVPILSAELNATAGGAPVDESPFVIILVTKGDADFSDAKVLDEDGELVFAIDSDGLGGRANWLLSRNDLGEWRTGAIMGLS
jgi:hypothetical protein